MRRRHSPEAREHAAVREHNRTMPDRKINRFLPTSFHFASSSPKKFDDPPQTTTVILPCFVCLRFHFGDVTSDCFARAVEQDQTILYERPSEVAPHAPATRRIPCTHPDQQQKMPSPREIVLIPFFEVHHRKALEE